MFLRGTYLIGRERMRGGRGLDKKCVAEPRSYQGAGLPSPLRGNPERAGCKRLFGEFGCWGTLGNLVYNVHVRKPTRPARPTITSQGTSVTLRQRQLGKT